jgi:large subunit ribosomal protein L21
MPYAIVKTGGKQYRVEEGQILLVERLSDEAGATVALQPLLYAADDAVFDADGLKKVSVKARIVGHERGEKLRVFKFKPKRGYKRTTGHRQELTRLEITEVSGDGRSAPSGRAQKSDGGAGRPAEVTP